MDKKLLEEIRKQKPSMPVRKDGEGITAREYAKQEGMGWKRAADTLKELETTLLECKDMMWRGHPTRVWFRKKG